MCLDDLPLLIFEFLVLSFCVRANPGLSLEEGDQDARNVVVFHHLVDDGHRKAFHVVRDKANQAEARHRALELNICNQLRLLLVLRLADQVLGVLKFGVGLEELAVGQLLKFAHHIRKLAVAVVNQLDERVVCSLAGRPVEHKHFQNVQS